MGNRVADPAQQGREVKNIVRELRGERGWSQVLLAEQLGVSRQTINAIETGKYDPSLPLAFRLSALFGRSIESLFQPDAVDAPPSGGRK